MKETLIEIKNISKSFKKKIAINDISLKIAKGSITGLFGENGAGKTTLMKLITNQIKPDEGQVYISGEKVEFNAPIHTEIGCLLNNPSFYPYLTAREHFSLYSIIKNNVNDSMIEDIVEAYDMREFIDTKAKGYSLGMKQRLGLAIAELLGEEILILDEPFNGLDPMNMKSLRERLLELKRRGKTIILSSHLIRELEDVIDDLVIISKGSVVSSISVDEFMKGKNNSLEEEIISIMEEVIK